MADDTVLMKKDEIDEIEEDLLEVHARIDSLRHRLWIIKNRFIQARRKRAEEKFTRDMERSGIDIDGKVRGKKHGLGKGSKDDG